MLDLLNNGLAHHCEFQYILNKHNSVNFILEELFDAGTCIHVGAKLLILVLAWILIIISVIVSAKDGGCVNC